MSDETMTRIKRYLDEQKELEEIIDRQRHIITMREIREMAEEVYRTDGPLYDLRLDPSLGENSMIMELYELYMIKCHCYDIIPNIMPEV